MIFLPYSAARRYHASRTKVQRLHTLIEVDGVISSSLNLALILESVMSISKQTMNADASSDMLIDEKK